MRVLVVLVVLLTCGVAVAENREEAAKEFAAGQAADDAKDYKNAIDHYLRAYNLAAHHYPLYNIAVAYEHLNNLREAVTWYERYLDEAPRSLVKERRDVEKLIVQLRARPAKVQIKTNKGARVLVDGQGIGQVTGAGPFIVTVRGGQHRVRVELDGERDERDIVVQFGESPAPLEMMLKAGADTAPTGTTGAPRDPYPAQIAPPSPSATTGMLNVTGTPVGAVITVDSKPVGRVPAEIPLEPGDHAIGVSSYGFQSVESIVMVQTGATTPFDVALLAGVTPTPIVIRAGYVIGAGGGADVSGSGAAGILDLGIRVNTFDFAVRVGKAMDLTVVDVNFRWAFLKTALTPFVQVAYGYASSKEGTTTTSGGYVLGGGLRYDVIRGETGAVSIVAEAGVRYYPSLDEMDGKLSRFGVPILVSAQVLYGKLR